MRVSVVVCTYNREHGLDATLGSLKLQRFTDFEVVVVNGPSTDGTAELLRRWADPIKIVDNPAANLSISRNLGIHASAGEIVAFIDDDALPEPGWLEQALPAFDEPEVAGVGGIVLDHTGMNPQYNYSGSTRFGEGLYSPTVPFDGCSIPGAAVFPYLQGTNALFRRSALAEVGLFDETFDFYLDETDVCVRLVDAGFVLRQLPNAPVHHKYLPSARRNVERVVTNWSSIMRNHVYFGYRHGLLQASEFDVIENALEFRTRILTDARMHEASGRADPGHVERAAESCAAAMAEGMRLGRVAAVGDLPSAVLDPPPFVRYAPSRRPDPLKIAMVSSGYTPNVTGGIARFISDVAPELAGRGHEVRVFARAEEQSTVDLEQSVWVHRLVPVPTPARIPDGPEHVDAFASAVANELERIEPWWQPDVLYGSLWDVEMLAVARTIPGLPVVPMLATPVAEVAEHEGWDDPRHPAHDDATDLVRLEREMIAGSVCVHAISDAIVATFDRLYPGALDPARIEVAHIGRADEVGSDELTEPPTPPVVLFVGRLEPRKGIDTFLDATAIVLAGNPSVRVVIAGDDVRPGPDGQRYPAAWRRRACEGADRVEFVGAVDDAELDRLMHASSIVVMPSRYESFGLVVVEAMMYARVPVASDVGGIAELIVDGDSGVLVPVGDAGALASSILDLLADPTRLRAIRHRARVRYESHLSLPAAADRLETVLRRALARVAVRGGAVA
jgi:glycogen(starch) synthase